MNTSRPLAPLTCAFTCPKLEGDERRAACLVCLVCDTRSSSDLVCRVVAPAVRQHTLSSAASLAAAPSLQVGVRIPSHVGSIGSCFTQNKVSVVPIHVAIHA